MDPCSKSFFFPSGTEMCFGFVGYYPKIPVYHWVAPLLAAACLPEL